MRFSIRLKFILAVLLCMVLVLLPGAYRLHQIETTAFEQEVHGRTQIVSEFGEATHQYVTQQLQPAIGAVTDDWMLEATSAYTTHHIFDRLNQVVPDYLYRQPALNPLNPKNVASDFEASIIHHLQIHPTLTELSGYHRQNGKEAFYIAKPLKVEASCLRCHGNPSEAPPELVAHYGDQSGYHWHLGEISSALMIYVPTEDLRATERAILYSVFMTFLWLGIVFVVAIFLLFEKLIHQRILRIGQVLQQRTLNPDATVQIRDRSQDELGTLARQFNQMALALDQVYQNLESKVHERTQALTQTLTTLKQTQSRLIQSEKMSGLGKMVGGIAHEINNPTNYIHANLAHTRQYASVLLNLLAQFQFEFPEAQRSSQLNEAIEESDLEFVEADLNKIVASMETGTGRIRTVVSLLRTFARLDEVGLKTIDLKTGIESALLMVQHRLEPMPERDAIQLVKTYAPCASVGCYPSQINQVIFSLLNNAIDAINERARLRHASDQVEDAGFEPQITIRLDQVGDSCRLAIVDNGVGITETVRQSMFDPFFTTKKIGQGVGLGLAVSYQIVVETHEGELLCESTPGEGTTMTVILPLSLG